MDEHENRCISVLVDEGLSLHTSKYYVGNWFLLLLVLFENDKRKRNMIYVSLVYFDLSNRNKKDHIFPLFV